eukprot:1157208-Pelagomonas_calceolata.AAC.10
MEIGRVVSHALGSLDSPFPVLHRHATADSTPKEPSENGACLVLIIVVIPWIPWLPKLDASPSLNIVVGRSYGKGDKLNVNQKHVHLIEIKYCEDTRPGQHLEAAQQQHAGLCKIVNAKGKATQAAHTSSAVLRKDRPPPPQGLELGNPRRLDEDEHTTQLPILTHRSPIHPCGLLASPWASSVTFHPCGLLASPIHPCGLLAP